MKPQVLATPQQTSNASQSQQGDDGKPEAFFGAPIMLVTYAFVVANIIWSLFDHGFPDPDAAGHALNGIQYMELLKHPHIFSPHWIYQFLTVNYLYPPAVYIFSGCLKLVFGIAPWVDGMEKALFQAVLCLAVYGVTFTLLKQRLAAVMAAIFINLYPICSTFSHWLMLDFSVVMMVAVGLWTLTWWQEKPTIKRTVVLGLVIGLACMDKQLAGAFLVPPCLIVFGATVLQRRFRDSAKLILAAVIPALISAPWVLVNYHSVQKLAQYNVHSIGAKGMTLTFPFVFSYYLSFLPQMMTPLLLAVFVASLAFAGWQTHKKLVLVLAASIGGLVLVSTLSWAYPLDRYIIPCLIGPAVYSGAAFAKLLASKRTLTKACACLILALASFQFVVLNYSPYPIPLSQSTEDFLRKCGIGMINYRGDAYQSNPEANDWGQKWVIKTINENDGRPYVFLNVMQNSFKYNVHTFQYVATLMNSRVQPTTLRQWSVMGDLIGFDPKQALCYHWYLLKTGDQGNIFADTKSSDAFAKLTDFVRNSGKFRFQASRTLPDHSTLLLYRQI